MPCGLVGQIHGHRAEQLLVNPIDLEHGGLLIVSDPGFDQETAARRWVTSRRRSS